MNELDDNALSGRPSLSEIESTRLRMIESARRPLWARVLLAIGYSLPFFAAAGPVWLLTVAVAVGFLALPSVLSLAGRARSGVSADVLSATRRTVRIQFGWAIAMVVLLAITVALAQFAHWALIGYVMGAIVLLATPFALGAAEAAALRGLGRNAR